MSARKWACELQENFRTPSDEGVIVYSFELQENKERRCQN